LIFVKSAYFSACDSMLGGSLK